LRSFFFSDVYLPKKVILDEGYSFYFKECSVNGIGKDAKKIAYINWMESVQDHSKFLQADRYLPVRMAAIPEEAARQLYECGYATDPEYPSKLIRIISRYNLKQYDITEGKA